MKGFPVIPPEVLRESQIKMKADIWPVTVCMKCHGENFGLRMGCHCGSESVNWAFKTYDGRHIRPEIDFSVWPKP